MRSNVLILREAVVDATIGLAVAKVERILKKAGLPGYNAALLALEEIEKATRAYDSMCTMGILNEIAKGAL